MPWTIRKDGDEYCVVKEDTGERVPGGCHPTREAAENHMHAILANYQGGKDIWLTREQVGKICPTCAKTMDDKNLARINLTMLNSETFRAALFEGMKAAHTYHTEKMERCLQHLLDKGFDEGSAHAICYAVLGEEANKSLDDLQIKVGARHSRQDIEVLQSIHDAAIELGAMCPPVSEIMNIPSLPNKSIDEFVVSFGGAVKALNEPGRLGGYLVMFSTANDPDLTGQFFTAETDFGPNETSLVWYQHGLDNQLRRRILDPKASLKKDDVGIWIEAQLELRDKYEKYIYEMAKKGKLGWSSGTGLHLIDTIQAGKAEKITHWPLGLDASLTPTPAEYRNGVIPLKSLYQPIGVAEAAGKAARRNGVNDKAANRAQQRAALQFLARLEEY